MMSCQQRRTRPEAGRGAAALGEFTASGRMPAAVGARGLCLAGGVAANSVLRERILDACIADGLRAFVPSRSMCTDNAAMVAAAGWWRLRSDGPSSLETGADPGLRLAGAR